MSPLIGVMAAGVLALNLVLVLGLIALPLASVRGRLLAACRQYGRLAVFLLSLLSVAATLWMQYGAGLEPCVLCWWQRVFMYPLPVITAIALVKQIDFADIADYVLGLSTLGAGVALYQHLLQMLPQGALIPCSANDECAIRSVFEFGYITLPWMALSVFAVLLFIAIAGRRKPQAPVA